MEPIRSHRGFTLIEMLVVLAIIVVITTVVLTSQSTFNKTLILKNTAYDIALSLRSAASFGIGSRATAGGATNVGYGIRFTTGNSFTVFADSVGTTPCHVSPSGISGAPDEIPGDCIYGAGELVQTYKLGNGVTVSGYCTYVGVTSTCTPGLSSLDIVFARPNPNPFISTNGTYSSSITKACVKVTSPQGGASSVWIAASGQISASQTPCP